MRLEITDEEYAVQEQRVGREDVGRGSQNGREENKCLDDKNFNPGYLQINLELCQREMTQITKEYHPFPCDGYPIG